ncbi:MAG: oligosaccharide flippase family protein [Verrucomicrobiaceae bacterium]|nr:oligosaccharide flippase family protein [Verrucomicrobiaceae bacterium]
MTKANTIDLKKAVIGGSAWGFAAQGAKLICQLGTTIILARILLPEHFGLVAILASFLAVFSHLRDLGIPTAMVQAESLEKPVTNTLFLISILLAILVAGATIVTGKVVSVYTSEPRIFAISFAMAGAIFF